MKDLIKNYAVIFSAVIALASVIYGIISFVQTNEYNTQAANVKNKEQDKVDITLTNQITKINKELIENKISIKNNQTKIESLQQKVNKYEHLYIALHLKKDIDNIPS